MHCIPFAFSKCFMHLDVCLYVENCVLIDLDWVKPMMQFFFYISHVHAFFMYTYHFFSIFWYSIVMVLFCLSPSLSLFPSQIVYAWHPNTNSLRLGTLFVPGHLPLILLLFTFGSMMRRPVRTSRRTSLNVAFTQNLT